jgi:hypothetical protein
MLPGSGPPDAAARPSGWWRRALELVALACGGVLVGVAGHRLTGHDAWFLAIPAALAAGWLLRADPTQCVERPQAPKRPGA